MITQGDGWKELRYICLRSDIFALRTQAMARAGTKQSGPQAHCWQKALRDRDGKLSDASVKIYQSNIEDCPFHVNRPCWKTVERSNPRSGRINWLEQGWVEGVMYDRIHVLLSWLGSPSQWCPFTGGCHRDTSVEIEQQVSQGTTLEEHGRWDGGPLLPCVAAAKGVRSFAKRGSRVDYTAKSGSAVIAHDIRGVWPGPDMGRFPSAAMAEVHIVLTDYLLAVTSAAEIQRYTSPYELSRVPQERPSPDEGC